MGLGVVIGEVVGKKNEKFLKIKIKDGKWLEVKDLMRMYIVELWVGKG